jgi:asparagine synthase (glutamine-hydrolysing)
MCGITGILEYARNERNVTTDLLTRMSDVIAHRGPDDAGTYVSPDRRLGFGFRRLAIVDLSPAGHQPMSTADGRFTIVFNGEVYNHLELRKELEAKGYTYKSRSDTETILYGFREWGTALFSKMLGMWGMAIWDEEKKELVCARDRIGIKPFYYTQQHGRFIFGSEIKSILAHPDVSVQPNLAQAPYYLTYMTTPAPETLFAGIHKLEAGTLLTVHSDGSTSSERYWDILDHCAAPRLTDSARDIEETVIAMLRRSIKDRMMSDVPFGVFLSGGIDSSTNVALMAELMNRPVQTFTVGFKELAKYNELEYARQIAHQFKTDHHEVMIDHNDACEVFDELVWHEDEPNGDPVCIPLYFVSRLARQSGTIVLQVGEGSDEEFAGYSWMRRDVHFEQRWWKPYMMLPRPLRRMAHAAASMALLPAGRYLELDYARRAAVGDELSWGGAIDITPTHQRRLFGRGLPIKNTGDLATRYHNILRERRPSSSELQQIIFTEFRHRLPELLLMRVDKITMAHSIEARVPFLDHRIVEYAMRIPDHLKLRGDQPKYVLKKAVEGIIPSNIIHRPKQGFHAPTTEWFRGPLADYARHRILDSPMRKEAYFDYDGISRLLAAHAAGRKHGQTIWSILNFTMWWERWFGSRN